MVHEGTREGGLFGQCQRHIPFPMKCPDRFFKKRFKLLVGHIRNIIPVSLDVIFNESVLHGFIKSNIQRMKVLRAVLMHQAEK